MDETVITVVGDLLPSYNWHLRWPLEYVRVCPLDGYDSMDESAGASVDDLIDDIDAVLDSYRQERQWIPPR